jgi:hypothetical protein
MPSSRKLQKPLKVPVRTTREAVKSHPHESHTLNSWMSSIKINGLPFIKAFHYYLETQEIKTQTLDDAKLKNENKGIYRNEYWIFCISGTLGEQSFITSRARKYRYIFFPIQKHYAKQRF